MHLRASNFVGGPESQLLRYAVLDRDGPCEILLGIYVGPEEGTELRDAAGSCGLGVIPLPVRCLASSVYDLVHTLQRREIQLLCTHGYRADVVGLLAGRLAGVPVACFLRGWTRENRRVRLYEALDRCCLRFAQRIVCLSSSQADRVSTDRSLSAKIRIVINAIDTYDVDASVRTSARHELQRRFNLPEKCAVIATAGRLSPEKAVGDFLDAAFLLRLWRSDLRFLIFGSGPLQLELKKKVVELGLQDFVTFAGFERNLRTLLPGVNLLVNPSHSEEMPNVVLEGMAACIPVIATAVGGVEEIAGPQGAVRLVPPGNPSAQAEAVIELLSNPERAIELAKAGHDRTKEYSPEKQRGQFHALYEELLPTLLASPPSDESNSSFKKIPHGHELPFVSIVLPVRNEETHIGAVLAQLHEQDYPHDRFEVVVAVGPSGDRTAQVIQDFKENAIISVRQFDNPHGLSSAGRNIGALNARGDYVIFIDGHCRIPSKTLLRDAVQLFQKTGADCLCRPQPLTTDGNSLFQDMIARTRATLLGHGRGSTIFDMKTEGPVNPSSGGAMYCRSVFDRIGFYDETFDACEDLEFNYRIFKAGLKSYASPRLTIFYQPRATARLLWHQMLRYGRGRFRLIQKHRDAFSLSQIVPAVFLVWLVVGAMSSAFSRLFFLVFVASLCLYAAVVFCFSLGLARRHGFDHLLICPIIFLTIHLGLGGGFLLEALRSRYRRRYDISERATSSTTSGQAKPAGPLSRQD
jgi:succinoglycan biosynthesis protein ExoA